MTPPLSPQTEAGPEAPPPEKTDAKRPSWVVLGRHAPERWVGDPTRPVALVVGTRLTVAADARIVAVEGRDDGGCSVRFSYRRYKWQPAQTEGSDIMADVLTFGPSDVFPTRAAAAEEAGRRRIERFIAERIYGAVS